MSQPTNIDAIATAYAGIIYDGHFSQLPRKKGEAKIAVIVKEACDQSQLPMRERLKGAKVVILDLMAGQEFDGGGHITNRVPPDHSAVVKAKIWIETNKQK